MARSTEALGNDQVAAPLFEAYLQGWGARLLGISVSAIGAIGLARGDFTIVYHPMPESIPARALVATLCNAGLLATGTAIALDRARRAGAGLLAALLLFLSLGWGIRVVLFPAMIGTWLGLAEQLALVTGALAVVAQARRAPAWLAMGTRTAFGLCQLVFALGHFLSLPETIAMTPSYLPGGPRFWALATGALHLAGGSLLLAAVRPVLVTRCVAAMFSIFGLLVWLPMLLQGPTPASVAGNLINLALVGAVLTVGDAIVSRSK